MGESGKPLRLVSERGLVSLHELSKMLLNCRSGGWLGHQRFQMKELIKSTLVTGTWFFKRKFQLKIIVNWRSLKIFN